MRILLAASVGGHLAQILALQEVISEHDVSLVTEWNEVTRRMDFPCRVYFLHLNHRKSPLFLWKMVLNTLRSLKILRREKPHVIISTGANATIPICLIGKLLGSRLVFIESFAKVKSPTKTGKLLYKWADLFIVQWPDLLQYYPNAKWGALF